MIDRQAFELEVKLAGAEGEQPGAITGYGAVFGNIDRGGDVVLPGAFKASIAELKRTKSSLPMLWQHWSSEPIGVWTELEEDDKGLKVGGRLVLEVPQAAGVRALVAAGAIKGLSIGYETVDSSIDRGSGVRQIKKARLWEVSLVTFPMNTEAGVTGVKAEFDARGLEQTLRQHLNLSSAAAVKAVALVKQHLRDGGDPPQQDDRDGLKSLLMSLRKASTAFE